MRNVLLMLIMVCSSGCAEIATNLGVQAGIQLGVDNIAYANNKPVKHCNFYNVARGYKMCRVSKIYRRG
jgi:uncharacterized protein YceK